MAIIILIKNFMKSVEINARGLRTDYLPIIENVISIVSNHTHTHTHAQTRSFVRCI
jgi:hypothetical protein